MLKALHGDVISRLDSDADKEEAGIADGPAIDISILHPTKSLTRERIAFLDSMSRETLISDTLVAHLAVEGLVVKAVLALLEEKIEFELPNDQVVRPVDRAELLLYVK